MKYFYIRSLIDSTYSNFDSELVKLLSTNEMVDIAFIFKDIVDKLNEIGYNSLMGAMLENTFSAMCAGDYSINCCRELTTSYANELKKYKVEPVCPLCLTKMMKVNYKGYYESFSYYKCQCESFTTAIEEKGNYVV